MDLIERHFSSAQSPKEGEHAPHRHDVGQFILVRRGILYGHVERSNWVLKPGMAAWVPAGLVHWGSGSKGMELAALYLTTAESRHFSLPAGPLLSTPLMVALCERLMDQGWVQDHPQRRQTMTAMLIEEIAEAQPASLVLPLPMDARLQRLTNTLMAAPRTLGEWGRQVGASERTLMRLFLRDTGLSFHQWYDRFLLIEAVRNLDEGFGNARIAERLGFASADSFGHWFRRVTGGSPSTYLMEKPSPRPLGRENGPVPSPT
ncbi:helix-turn-helix transcriptional regulator [Acidithiobacillus sp. IBUN Pt1247-S3]|uniref:AraC family transcriptional regulator n=1 Tax=Acidithiobacillus sp. IBUN Pt1247-S3 TaxID=3166642 RepID=UPI0034E55129